MSIDAIRIVAIRRKRALVELVHKRSKHAKTTRYGEIVYKTILTKDRNIQYHSYQVHIDQ